VDPRAGLDDAEERNFFILPGLELRTLFRSARSAVATPPELSRFLGGSNCVLFRSHVTGSNDATLGEVG
jgi:hypothetical protein